MRGSGLLFLALVFIAGCKTSGPSGSDTSGLTPVKNRVVKLGSAALLSPNTPLSRIAFGSCADPAKPQPIWKVISSKRPQLWVGMGDNVYLSKQEPRAFNKAYYAQLQIKDFAEFRMQVPMIATWDDNDYGPGDSGAENPEKENAKLSYMEFFPNDAMALDPRQSGIYHSFLVGNGQQRVQIILLDTRYFRDPLEKNLNPKSALDIYQPTADTKKTILGAEQWKWLEQELQKPAEIRMIVSSIQVVAAEHGFEKWENFPHEKQRLFDLFTRLKLKNVFITSGDRHAGEISKITLLNVGDVYDVTASGLNRTSGIRGEKNSARVGPVYPDENFGLAEIDWKKKKMTLKLVNLEGQDVSSVKVDLKL